MVGLMYFLIQNALLIYLSYWISSKINLPRGLLRWIATSIIAISLISIISISLIQFHIYRIEAIIFLMILIFLVVVFSNQHERTFKCLIDDAKIFLNALIEIIKMNLVISTIMGLVLSSLFLRGILTPPISWDSLTYHLFNSANWIIHRGFFNINAPDESTYYKYFAMNGEILYAWFMLPFRSDFIVNTVNIFVWLLLLLVMYVAMRELSISRRFSFLSSLFMCSFPAVMTYITTEYTDSIVLSEIMIAYLFFIGLYRTQKVSYLYMAMISSGCAIGTKFTGILILPIILFVLAALIIKRALSMKHLTIAILLLLLNGAPWYIRNQVATGNPIYPIEVTIGNKVIFKGDRSYNSLKARMESEIPNKIKENKQIILQPFSDETKEILIPIFAATENDNFGFGFTSSIAIILFLFGFVYLIKEKRFAELVVCSLLLIFGFAFYYSSGMRFARSLWMTTSMRFLTIPFCIMTMMTIYCLSKIKNSICLEIFLYGGISLNLTNSIPRGFISLDYKIIYYQIIIFIIVFVFYRILHSRFRILLYSIIPITIIIAFICLQIAKDTHRAEYFLKGYDLHDFPRYSSLASALCDNPEKGFKISFTAGWDGTGHNWLWYPVMGRRLQNTVMYVPITKSGEIIDYEVLDAKYIDFFSWHNRLCEKKIDFVVTHPPLTYEFFWITQYPQYFKILYYNKQNGFSMSQVLGCQ